uniref:Chromosome transmission fidelity protein 18 homolog n=1 Tax=Sinocyclocheilus grahami TaxID=75366 RepID=A0A672MVV8_SINGR
MDEYDEMYGIEDDFEQQFADELEVMAEMDLMQCLISLWFLTAPKPKKRRQDVVKKLQFGVENCDDITPPSSPEVYDRPQVTTARHAQKRPPAIGDYITVTDSMGNRVYLNKKEDKEKRHRQVLEESQRLTELMNSGISPELLAEEQKDSGVDGDSGEDEGLSSRLWVDQFSPQHYTDLLSDDFTNRCLLKWLKLWDTVVFGRERKPRSTPADVRSNFTNAQNQNQSQRFKTKSQMTEEILEAELDQYKRPKFKVALLSGPPGLGKTTLAHIIAKHAGYNVVEINASDDRSAELFQKRIDTATQMKSVLGANEKPNCLIIDEIDGAPAAAINILLATLNRKDSREGEESGGNALKKRKKKQSVLLRPIICICNDLYVPALRPLRQQAFLLTFPQTLPSRLAQRLAEITRRHGMKADTGTLMALCEKTDNDIRACINTLQFLHSRGQKHLDQRSVNSISVGLKDQNKGLFSVWQEIFQLPRLKRKRIGGDSFGGFDEAGPKDGTQRLQHILHLVSSNGEHEKLTQGLYDNFLSMKLKDPGMLGVCAGLDWMCFSDLLNECVLHGQNYSLMRYFPFLPAAFHHLYAANSVPRINYPHSNYEAFTKTQHTKNALLAMLNDIPPAVQSRISISCLCLDILSLLLDLISPKLRPVNPQLYSTREKQQLYDLIDTMINYNLTYRQDRTPEGQYTYTETVKKDQEGKKTEVKKQTNRNHQQRLENIVKQTVVESRPELDFFGRAIVPKEKPAVTTTSVLLLFVDVWFRFNEGVSNAVRRNVYIRELL